MELAVETKLSQKSSLKDYDSKALTKTEQDELNQLKIKIRVENERYLRSHPEISAMISSFTNKVLLERPEDLREFAADFFSDPNLSESLKPPS
jgi:hypothetical protein